MTHLLLYVNPSETFDIAKELNNIKHFLNYFLRFNNSQEKLKENMFERIILTKLTRFGHRISFSLA